MVEFSDGDAKLLFEFSDECLFRRFTISTMTAGKIPSIRIETTVGVSFPKQDFAAID